MTLIQPAIGLIDAGIGHVRQIATGFDQVGLTIDIAPDNPHLLAGALTTQCAAQFVIAGCGLRGSSNLPAQLAGAKVRSSSPERASSSNIKGSRKDCSIKKSLAALTRLNADQRSGDQSSSPCPPSSPATAVRHDCSARLASGCKRPGIGASDGRLMVYP
jgi:hypothetical protein